MQDATRAGSFHLVVTDTPRKAAQTYIERRAGEFGVPMYDLLGPTREHYVAVVRMLIMSEVREFFIHARTGKPLTLLECARLLGRTDHKTAHHAVATGREALERAAISIRNDRRQERASRVLRRATRPRRAGELILAAGCSRQLVMR